MVHQRFIRSLKDRSNTNKFTLIASALMLEIQVLNTKMRQRSRSCRLLCERRLRGIALIFLLFTFANIVFPPPCSEASDCVAKETTLSGSQLNDDQQEKNRTYLADNDSSSDRSPCEHCSDEDCCFGCAHMLTMPASTGDVGSNSRSQSEILSKLFVPTPPLRLTDHPPRFA